MRAMLIMPVVLAAPVYYGFKLKQQQSNFRELLR